MHRVYDGFDTASSVETTMWQEVLRIINEATVEGLAEADVPPTHDQLFYQQLRHSNEVFSAFKVHTMGREMAAKLLDESGHLKPFAQWARDVSGITSHQVGEWLRTEYDTAVLRAHAAADWQEFERNKDVMPNLRWMPTTSPTPEGSHRKYWEAGLTLPVDDPFWNQHHPGDRWNCKCSLEATDDPVVRLPGMEPEPPQRGLENNPGKDGHTFNDTHPYFPSQCNQCPFNAGFKAKLATFFTGAKKDCYHCSKVDHAISDAKQDLDVTKMFARLPKLSGADYIKEVRKIANLKIYQKVEDGIFSAISPSAEDYDRLLAGAKKAVRHGYTVYLLPNPHGARSADYIFCRKGIYKMFDLKTITGQGSIGSRLKESIGQTNRVYLNLATTYSANRMAGEIQNYFEANGEALEVMVAVGNKMISVERNFVMKRTFFKEFRREIEK